MDAVSKSSALKALICRVSKSTAAIIAIRVVMCVWPGGNGRRAARLDMPDIRASQLEACRNLAWRKTV